MESVVERHCCLYASFHHVISSVWFGGWGSDLGFLGALRLCQKFGANLVTCNKYTVQVIRHAKGYNVIRCLDLDV